MEVEHFRSYVRERRRDDCARFRGEYSVSGLTVGRCEEVCGGTCGGSVGWCVEEVWDGVGKRCGMVWGGGVGWCVEEVWDGVGRRCGGGVWKRVEVCGGGVGCMDECVMCRGV